ncbi:hypothetical protein M0811_14266 [Anaeramoeba ignava]|uniref:Uncharacterized protein n=1 Tax=Anaeramoeba ignava TaxID=1746090 RepID=A0A9Q0LW64_ANAIG|nr:hypothetical protein M0811_14266 [Anaeramoeba ignava]
MESLLVRGYLYLVADALLYPRTKNYPRNFFFQFSDSEEEIRDFDSIKFEELQATNNEQRLEILTNFGFQDFLSLFQSVELDFQYQGRGARRMKQTNETNFLMTLFYDHACPILGVEKENIFYQKIFGVCVSLTNFEIRSGHSLSYND